MSPAAETAPAIDVPVLIANHVLQRAWTCPIRPKVASHITFTPNDPCCCHVSLTAPARVAL